MFVLLIQFDSMFIVRQSPVFVKENNRTRLL